MSTPKIFTKKVIDFYLDRVGNAVQALQICNFLKKEENDMFHRMFNDYVHLWDVIGEKQKENMSANDLEGFLNSLKEGHKKLEEMQKLYPVLQDKMMEKEISRLLNDSQLEELRSKLDIDQVVRGLNNGHSKLMRYITNIISSSNLKKAIKEKM